MTLRELYSTNLFRKDLKRAKKRGKDLRYSPSGSLFSRQDGTLLGMSHRTGLAIDLA